MEAAVAPASYEDGDQELDDLWFDLLALKKLCGLLRRADTENFVPHGEMKDMLDEKSKNLLKKLLDGATQQSLNHQHTNTPACEQHQHHPATTEQESKLLLMIRDGDERSTEEIGFAGKQHLQGDLSGVDGPPPPPPKHSLAVSLTFSGTSTPEPQAEINGCPDCYFERLNSGGLTRNLLLQDPWPTHGQSHRRRHPTHGGHRVIKSTEQNRRHIHGDRSVKQSRQSHQSAAGTSPPNLAMKSSPPAADLSDPMPEGTGMIRCRLVCDPAQLKLVGDSSTKDSRRKNDDLVPVKSKESPRNETVERTLTGPPSRGIEQNVFDRTGKIFKARTGTDEEKQIPRRNTSSSHLSKRSNHSSIVMGPEQQTRHRRRHRPSIRNGEDEIEALHRRRKQPPRAASRKASSRSRAYSGNRATRSSSYDSMESSQFSRSSHSLLRRVKSHFGVGREPSKSGRTASDSRRSSMDRPVAKKHSNHSLSRHSRRTEVPSHAPLKERKEEPEGKLERLKNKLSIILHHHHNHHHHLHRGSSEDKEDVVSEERCRHRSLWGNLLGSTHCTSRTERDAPQRHHHLHAVLKELIQHMFLFVKRRRRPKLRPNTRAKKLRRGVGARSAHWWQRLRRHPRFIHVARARLRLGTGRRIK